MRQTNNPEVAFKQTLLVYTDGSVSLEDCEDSGIKPSVSQVFTALIHLTEDIRMQLQANMVLQMLARMQNNSSRIITPR